MPGRVDGGENLAHISFSDEVHAFGERDVTNTFNDTIEATLCIEHTVFEVEVAHQVIHRRGDVGAGAEEHSRVSENLLQSGVAHVTGSKLVQGLVQQLGKFGCAAQNIRTQQWAVLLKAGVEETLLGDLVGVFGGVEVALHRRT